MRRNAAFTLVEIMIVVLIIGILLAVATPQWVATRSKAQQGGCLGHLKTISNAKEQFALENNRSNGDPVVAADLHPSYIKGTTFPACPGSGTYTIDVVGTDPTCSLSAAAPHPHVLP